MASHRLSRTAASVIGRRVFSAGSCAGHDLEVTPLHGSFGALLQSSVSVAEVLSNRKLRHQLRAAWQKFGGLLVIRGLADMTPEKLVAISEVFGSVEPCLDDSKLFAQASQGVPVMRIGNTRDDQGRLTAVSAKNAMLPPDGSPQYDAQTRRPVWHTDGTYRAQPPIGSALYCKTAPPTGGATCFADMRSAYNALEESQRHYFEGLECLCSLAHHDAKISGYSPEYPTLTAEQRETNPPQRAPMVLTHPRTGLPALYGWNSSTCAVVPKGADIPQRRLDDFDLRAVEDESVAIWRDLLPFVTSDRFTVKWQWAAGDLVIWDNRCTLHCATGFDESYDREMWRTTLVSDAE